VSNLLFAADYFKCITIVTLQMLRLFTPTPTLTSRISRRICTNYASGPGRPWRGQLLHLLHTSYSTGYRSIYLR